jgi:hypothetical protein
MMITRTTTGNVLIQSGDDSVELTMSEVETAAEILAGYVLDEDEDEA